MNVGRNRGMPEERALSHDQAEQLISDRLDGPLNPQDSRDLLLHLAGCQSCTAFAVQMEVMARELEALPMLPASPVVSRQVRETIYSKQSFWDRLGLSFQPGRWSAMPAAVAALAVVISLASVLLIRQQQQPEPAAVPAAIEGPSELAQVETGQPTATENSVAAVNQDRAAATNTVRVVQPPPSTTQEAAIDTSRYEETLTPSALAAGGTGTSEVSAAQPGETAQTGNQAPASSTATESISGGDSTSDKPAATGVNPVQVAESESNQTTTAESDSENIDPSATTEAGTNSNAVIAADESNSATPDDESIVEIGSTATATPTEQAESAVTATPTPSEIVEESTATEVPTDIPTEIPTELSSPTATATELIEPSLTPTVEEQPFVQPTIAPSGGGVVDAAAVQPTDTPTEVSGSIDGQGQTDSSSDSGGSTKIESTDSDGSSEDTAIDPTADSQPDESIGGAIQSESGNSGSTVLDTAPVVGTLPPGTSAPSGRLEFRPQLDLFVVILADGQLAVSDTGGSIVAALGSGGLPIWSPAGIVLLYNDFGGGNPTVSTWDSESGSVYPVGIEVDGSVIDTPAGWVGDRLYYQRTFPDTPGRFQLRSANWDGSGDVLVYESGGVYPVSERPVAANGGIILADASRWLTIYPDGSSIEMESNVFGSVGAPILSPGGSLIAYDADGSVYIAGVDAPGSPYNAAIPYQGGLGSGYAFATTGEQIAVSEPGGLGFYGIDGTPLASASASSPISAPYWVNDQVYFLQIDSATSLKVASASDIYASEG
jgi:Putative zinc-finger